MGKNLIQQARGKGSSTYRAHSFHFEGKLSYGTYAPGTKTEGTIVEILHCRGHSAPLLRVIFGEKEILLPGNEGAYVGKKVVIDHRDVVSKEEIVAGNAYLLKNIPEGATVYNIEIVPGDSGRLMKTAGSFATVVGQAKDKTKLLLSSKKEKLVLNYCRAFVGVIGGGGRHEKPILKAGLAWMESRKKNKLYPRISGLKQNAVDHPHGGTRSSRKGRPTIAPHNAPPGRKVGMLRPRHTGRNK